jgi:hypothetical protein
MLRTRYLLPAMLIGLGILIGCKPNGTAVTVTDKSLETKVARLEADLKKANDEIARLSAQVRLDEAKTKELEKERDELRLSLKDRVNERDLALGKLDSFRKNVKDLLGQMDAAVANPYKPLPEPVTILPPPVLPNMSVQQ